MGEKEIIQKIIAGDESAFRKLVETHQSLVANTCLGLVHNVADAEDLAQEVFIEVFRSIHKFKADSKISTWLYRIAVNRSLNFIRDNKKNRWFQSFDDVVKIKNTAIRNMAATKTDEPGFELESRQRATILHEAIDTLPKNQKVAFTLSKYEDLSNQEISEVMELSVSAVEALLHRAKRNLQTKLYQCYKKKCI